MLPACRLHDLADLVDAFDWLRLAADFPAAGPAGGSRWVVAELHPVDDSMGGQPKSREAGT